MKLIIQLFIYIFSMVIILSPTPILSESYSSIRHFQYYIPGLKKTDNVNVELYDSNYNKVAEEKVQIQGKKMNIRKTEGTIEILSQYDKENDLLLTIGRVSNNNTWQISNAYLVTNKQKSANEKFDGEKILLNRVYTDYVSPYHQLRAINNIDGDEPNGEGYTGGWHAYENSKGSPTSTMESYKLLLDNVQCEQNGTYEAQKVQIETTNLVQGINTKKVNGNGRPILKEKITYTIVDGTIDVEVNLKAMEDITMEDYYFLQASTNNFNNGILPMNDKLYPFEIKNLSQDIYGGSKINSNCSKIVLTDGSNNLSIGIDPNYGIGDFKYNSHDCRWFYRNYGKVYFNPISMQKNDPLRLNKGEILKARGFYSFEKRINILDYVRQGT